MNFLILISLTSVFGFVFGGDGVLELSDNDFKSRLGELDTVLVMFYAPW